MTVGELARLFRKERDLPVALMVVPVEGWKREMWFDQTMQPWTNPSPNMRNLAEAIIYPGLGLLESAISVGRGTDTPFEVLGAPYVDDTTLARELNRTGLPGVRFVPIRFTPRASVFKDQACGGVYLSITDRESVQAVDVGMQVALTLQRLYPKDLALEKVQTLLQDASTIEAIRSGKSLSEIKSGWEKALEAFRGRRQSVLLYP
jgi:uncharacterized protein YbbC (DUF1343 family)